MNQVLRPPMASEKSLENKRRTIYTALIEHLSDDELWESLARWEDNYAEAPVFSAQKFLSDVLDTPELRSKRARILQSLIKLQSSTSASLLPDPREQLLVFRMRRSKSTSLTNSRDPAVVAFCSFLTRVLKNLDNNNHLRMRLFILDKLEKSGMAATTRTAIRVWLSEKSRLLLINAETTDLRKLINIAYIGLCEYIGPVAADAALNKAFKQVAEEEAELLPMVRRLL